MISVQHFFWYIFKNVFAWTIIYNTHFSSTFNNVVTKDLSNTYDFIIVGGGTAGSTLAGRLSEKKDLRILLVESGGEQSIKLKIPWFHSLLYGSPHSWHYLSEDQEHNQALLGYDGKKSIWWRGRVIGGTGAINTMIYMRGNRHDYDHWALLGNEGWSFSDVLPFFRKLENVKGTDLEKDVQFHGTEGPMKIEYGSQVTPLQKGFLNAGKLLGYPISDPNSYNQFGFSKILFTIKDGQRWTSSDAYLHPENPNLKVSINSHVLKIIIKHKKAMGIDMIKNGKIHRIYAKKEVILSAGVLESPRLLMLSGIGPQKHLERHKIKVNKDLPGVGQNLQDHIASYGLIWLTKTGAAYSPFRYTLSMSTYINWKLYSRGPLSSPIGVEGNAFVHTKYGNSSWPDLQMTFLSVHPGYDGGTLYKNFLGLSDEIYSSYFADTAFKEGYTIYPILNRPKSRGYVELQSSNPFDSVKIQPNYLSNKSDLQTLVEGMKIARKIGDSPAFKKYGSKFYSKPFPPCLSYKYESDPYWECWIRHLATTDHHPVGTCKMGPLHDPLAVVDNELRVYGIEGLRVVDGSILPTLPSGNINIPITMVAEKISQAIKSEYKKLI
ncbi:unnamed protein product [Lepeophtheirus salmonis]|uniref:(salmon louse) hypothetical protein n=1 Tax=Lepeophtheirus salmonis TaxID=72036 RepID=A0A7R8H5P9_LEPSM|nr:unnamed protein product [Lepeophtheirus salmonis]CAF2881702.1 unnamed protein product [Lepeophtheirus salmonis]